MTSHRRLVVCVGIACASVPLLALPASATPIDDKKRDAARIQSELDSQGERISVLDEQYNRARLRADETDAKLAGTQRKLTAADARYRTARARLASHAVDAYIKGGSTSLVEELAKSRGTDLALRHHYLRAAAASERRAIDDLRAAREDLTELRRETESAQKAASKAATGLKSDRSAIERAVGVQQATLSKVKGELAALVAQEDARRAAEAGRRAQAELARQAAARARPAPPRATTPTQREGSKPKPPPTDAPPVGRGAAAAVAEARRQIGKPYVWAAAGPDSFDCSGLTQWAWRAGGVRLSHSTYAQWDETPHIPVSALQTGDLVYFGDDLHHMAIYSGGGMMIEAPYTGTTVRERPLRTKDLVGATRPG